MSTLAEILSRHVVGDEAGLLAELTAREDRIADQLRQAGLLFGLYPEIVAEVVAECGLGTPLGPEARRYVRHQFVARMQWIRDNQ